MITCERCQTENLEGAQYCDECGAALGAAAAAGNNAAPRRLTYDDAGAEVMPFAADSGAARRAPAEPSPAAVSKPQQAVSPLRTSLASRPGTFYINASPEIPNVFGRSQPAM